MTEYLQQLHRRPQQTNMSRHQEDKFPRKWHTRPHKELIGKSSFHQQLELKCTWEGEERGYWKGGWTNKKMYTIRIKVLYLYPNSY